MPNSKAKDRKRKKAALNKKWLEKQSGQPTNRFGKK